MKNNEQDFLTRLMSKTWASNGDNTVENSEFNPFPEEDWRRKLIEKNFKYYPPGKVNIKIHPKEIIRDEYSVPHAGKDVIVPKQTISTFTMEVTGTHFDGKEMLNAARFVILGDHAVSSPMTIPAEDKAVYIVVRLLELDTGRLIMVNELIWSVQYQNNQTNSQKFHDIQKWYCCGYP